MTQATWTTQEIDEKRLLVTVKIDAAGVEEELRRKLSEARKTAKVDGFRVGKVPDAVLMRKFGEQILKITEDGLLEGSAKIVATKITKDRGGELPEDPTPENAVFSLERGLTYELRLTVPPKPPEPPLVHGLPKPGDGTVIDLRGDVIDLRTKK